MIELRSDTFTLPSRAMIRAMSEAELGDDVYGEDPTVRALEERSAELLGKGAACLMPSGTMANLASIMVHAPRGSKMLVGTESDIYIYEAAGATVCGGVMYEPVPNRADGTLALADLARGFPDDPTDEQFALPSLICLENTQNRCGGVVLPQSYLREVREFATARGVAVHLDGARLFNAATALGIPAAEITRYADSVQFCLSKGLSAPIGSMAAGDEEFVRELRRVRKMLGGGMRQAGVIAAAGLVALDNLERLHEDHAHARRLAQGLAEIDGIDTDPEAVQTNIVMFRVTDARFTWQTFVEAVGRHGLALAELGHGRLRAVTHSGVSARDVDEAVAIVRRVLSNGESH
ncbi:GntG family PLP-dependent aldolase [Streptomyces viridochromogenes]|uniref:Putative Glycine hydroxymethyltransferase n=1 Tax=Streptomyces viridochromogenes Tue57 TaxID=1160705 RepID=L8PLR2_STRVR|nr:GntG family PLP-dependent aldolase [Streptomyces viridochromogenes]ELS56302.1 putative Glycine hydroxymethyltransferase [Streptomyces viridochromogenes Tue57]